MLTTLQKRYSVEGFKLTRWEIRPNVARETVVDFQNPALHRQLARMLKRMISQAIYHIKVTPRTQNIDNNASDKAPVVVPATDKEVTCKRSTRMKTSALVGELSVNFQLPEDCIASKIDMDQLSDTQGNTNLMRRFSFKERLQGWTVECRQRPSKTYDMFYRYQKSRRMFRSITEVVKFMLFERYPNSFKPEMGIQANNLDTNNAAMAPAVNRKRKTEEETELEFLADAYNNLPNLAPPKPNSEKEAMSESEYQGFISGESHSYERVENETAEDMIETVYNDLVNVSHTKKKSRKEQKCNDALKFSSVPFNTMGVLDTSKAAYGLEAEFQEEHQAIAEALLSLKNGNSRKVEEANNSPENAGRNYC